MQNALFVLIVKIIMCDGRKHAFCQVKQLAVSIAERWLCRPPVRPPSTMHNAAKESDFFITIPKAASSLDASLDRFPVPSPGEGHSIDSPAFIWSNSPGTSAPRRVIYNEATLMPMSARVSVSERIRLPPRPSTTTHEVPHVRLQPLDKQALPTTKSQSPRWWDMPKHVATECERFDGRHGELSERAFERLAHVEDDLTNEKADWYFRRYVDASGRLGLGAWGGWMPETTSDRLAACASRVRARLL
jgi:hypothetical protein